MTAGPDARVDSVAIDGADVAPPVGDAATAIDPAATAGAAPVDGTTAGSPAVPAVHRRRRYALGAFRVATFFLGFAIFALGIGIGVGIFRAVQPPPPDVVPGVAGTTPAPAIVVEMVNALQANDTDSVRAAIRGEAYRLLAGELQTRGFAEVTSIDTLGTVVDGDRTATEIVLHGRGSDGTDAVINLVVITNTGQIVNFR